VEIGVVVEKVAYFIEISGFSVRFHRFAVFVSDGGGITCGGYGRVVMRGG